MLIESDAHRLKKVIIHPIGNERKYIVPRFGFLGIPGFSGDISGSDIEVQHEELRSILENQNVEVLNTYDLIENALANLKKKSLLESWINNNFPKLLKIYKTNGSIDASDLVGASDRSFFDFEGDSLVPLANPLVGIYFIRDWGAVLDEGVVISNFGSKKRSAEIKIAKLIFSYADQLADIPIIFDGTAEDALIQGGDIIVFDKDTLLIGIDNMTERKAAELIAQKLNKKVIGVILPKKLGDTEVAQAPFSSLFLHLDTIFNVIDSKKALTVPYFLENKYDELNPIYSILKGAIRMASESDQRSLALITEELRKVGLVVEFEAKTGKQVETKLKLVDYLKEKHGFSFVYTGGEPPENFAEQVKHMVQTVLPEIRFQATNIVVTQPNEVIIYKSNTDVTKEALRKSGVNILELEGYELARTNGGPHCMTLPLVRASS